MISRRKDDIKEKEYIYEKKKMSLREREREKYAKVTPVIVNNKRLTILVFFQLVYLY